MANEVIRTKAKASGIKLYRIAKELGINDGNLSRKLRYELPESEQRDIIRIIERLEATDAENKD